MKLNYFDLNLTKDGASNPQFTFLSYYYSPVTKDFDEVLITTRLFGAPWKFELPLKIFSNVRNSLSVVNLHDVVYGVTDLFKEEIL